MIMLIKAVKIKRKWWNILINKRETKGRENSAAQLHY